MKKKWKIFLIRSGRLEQREGYGEGVVVYPAYSYTNHSCLCNTFTRKHRDNKMELIAQSDIKERLSQPIR